MEQATENHKTEDPRPQTQDRLQRVIAERRGEGLVYLDTEADRAYRRVVGGLAWPNPPQPGYLVVVGEAWKPEIVSGERPLWVLAEVEAGSVPELGRKCRELGYRFQAGPWYGDPGNLPMLRLLREDGNRRVGEWENPIAINGAPYYDHARSLGFYVQLIRDLVRVEKKVLHLGAGSQVAGRLMTLAPDDLGVRASDHPPLAALGYAVSALRLKLPMSDAALQNLVVTQWDPHALEG